MWSRGIGTGLADPAAIELKFSVIIANSTHTD